MTTKARIGALMGEALAPAPDPNGRPLRLGGVDALSFQRRLHSSPETAWRLLTDRRRAPHWLGSWHYEPSSATAEFRGVAEGADADPVHYRLVELDPGRRVELATRPVGDTAWRVRLELAPGPGDGTLLALLHTVPHQAFAPLVGATADFYLDRLVAVDQGRDPTGIQYDDYVAGQAGHYRSLFPGQRRPA